MTELEVTFGDLEAELLGISKLVSPPRAFYDPLGTCFLCHSPLGDYSYIFMYREASFCSQLCRQRQMDFDQNKEQMKINRSPRGSEKVSTSSEEIEQSRRKELEPQFPTAMELEALMTKPEVSHQFWRNPKFHRSQQLEIEKNPIMQTESVDPSSTYQSICIEDSDIGMGKSTSAEDMKDHQPIPVELFYENVGEIADSSSIQPLVRRIVEMCSHSSHAIILLARALNDESDIQIWNNAIETLSNKHIWDVSDQDELENIMVNALKFSYEHLPEEATRKCLKYFVQLYGSQRIEVAPLIESWIEEGLIDDCSKGNKIIKDLVCANLLKRASGDHQFLEFNQTFQQLLIDHIILPEEGRLFLMRGGLRLTEAPKIEEWKRSKVIYLMDNEISVLPENPSCLILEALFLQRNCRLRKIPSLFFDQMPCLKVLNLSRTRIKSLPESFFRLGTLNRLYLNYCELLMTLSPKIGELKHLEVLDLEGTEIMYLPKEMENLTKLKCLEVSFCEPIDHRRSKQPNTIVPRGIFSALSELEELNITASPDDERWNECAENVVSEVCSLKLLHTLKFYFPKVELLSYFKGCPPLTHFKFTVGPRVKRLISRVSSGIEQEFEQYDKCMKYLNGANISRDIKKFLGHANAFFLDRHATVKILSEFGYRNIKQLKCCIVGECNELQAIIDGDQIETKLGDPSIEYLYIYYMKSLRSIWKGSLNDSGFFFLKFLTLRTCPQLTTIFSVGLLGTISCLEELIVDDCAEIITLGSCYNPEEAYILPSLKKASLHYLPRLVCFSQCLIILPKMESITVRYCPNLKRLPIIDKTLNGNLKKIMGETSWWKALKWARTQDSWDHIFVPLTLDS